MKDFLQHKVCPLLAGLIWGTAFAVQTFNTAGTITFSCARSVVASVFLFFVLVVLSKRDIAHLFRGQTKRDTRRLWLGGILCGLAVSGGMTLQQLGIDMGTEAGKAGFLTTLYVVLVPVGAMLLGKKTPLRVWLSVGVAMAGLYLLCVKNGFSVRPSDALVLACALVYTCHILLIDHFTQDCDGVKLSCIQFIVASVVLFPIALVTEHPTWSLIMENFTPILYVGIFSSGVAFTLQMIAQKGENPPVVTVLLSTESVFSVLGGAVLLHEVLTGREYLGCALMFLAVMGSQIDPKKLFRKENKKTKEAEP